ncbi:hypothetical protein HB777_29330 [Mesorhizobium loti]|nr:hypothetical protein HB777_29330 [Mesorhizobium loti]
MATTSVDQVTGYGETVAYKAPCRLATTANIALSGLQTIDGSVTAADDRVLVKDQADARENGIYIASTGLWMRARDMDSNRDLTKGTRVAVTDGTISAGFEYQLTTLNPVSVGTSSITFAISSLSFVSKSIVRDYLDVAPYVPTRAALKALDTTKDTEAYLTESGREGVFLWRAGNFAALITADSQEGVFLKAGAIASAAGSWVRVFDGGLDVRWFGAVADDATDCTAAFQGAINIALAAASLSKEIYVKAGTYWFASASASLDPVAGGLIFRGEGWDASILHFEESTGVITSDPNYKCLFRNTDNIVKKSVRFEHLQFKGTFGTDPGSAKGGTAVWLDFYTEIAFYACKFIELTSHASMDIHYCGRFECLNCWVQDVAADGIRCRDTPNMLVEGNYIRRNGDDAIALHTADNSVAGTREGVIVTNNHLVNAGPIKVLGARVTRISGNRQELCNIAGIVVTPAATTPEGNYPVRDIIIENNFILDQVYITGGVPSSNAVAIAFTGQIAVGQAATHATRPGRYDATAAAWVYPWTYDEVDTDDPAAVVPPAMGYRISGNVIRRTRPAIGAFSSYGFGTVLRQGAASDPAIVDADLRPGIGMSSNGGSYINLLIMANIIESVGTAILLPAPAYNNQYEGVVIARNITRDIINRGFSMGSSAFTVDISIDDNNFDIDTYRQNANSNINGSYLADSVPSGVDFGNVVGLKIRRNRFQNACGAVRTNLPGQNLIDGNIIVGSVVGTGFSTSNKGIGNAEFADGRFLYEIIDADPTSATYLQNVSTQLIAAAAMPAAGFYVRGAFVRNSLPVAATNVIGWSRITTGNAHVLGVDWAAIYASGVMPEVKAIGYIAGSGSTVAQATDKTTGVSLARPTGQITMQATSLAAATAVSFTLTNAVITADDLLIINHKSGGTIGAYTINAQCTAGQAVITIRNNTAGALAEALVLQYALIQGAIT